MKTFKQFISKTKGAYVPKAPVHFKHVGRAIHEEVASANDNTSEHLNWMHTNHNPRLGENHEKVSQTLSDVTHKRNLHPDVQNSVLKHTVDSEDVNKTILKQHGVSRSDYRDKHNDALKHIKHIENMDKAARYPLKHELHAFSGISFNPAEHLGEHGRVKMPAYTSLTHDPATAYRFARYSSGKEGDKHILHVHLKPTDHGVHVSHLSDHPKEHETILPRGTTLNVYHKPRVHTDEHGAKVHIWHATVHHQR